MKLISRTEPGGIPTVTWNQYKPLIGAVKEFLAVFSKQFPSLNTIVSKIDKVFANKFEKELDLVAKKDVIIAGKLKY